MKHIKTYVTDNIEIDNVKYKIEGPVSHSFENAYF